MLNISSRIKKILAVDDDASVLELIPLIFESYLVKGISTIENLDKVIGDFKPDIILLDIVMGNIDGRTICNQLKNSLITAHIPVILLTASILKPDSIPCKSDAILEKPFDIYQLEALVERLIL
ncbi:response regulator [Pedobacter mucosus]|uniref:response regulator n=1 Tax=Pedobacter mucosus TaxID=2895286 RepID=UPI001EE46233|nr:response regulator [Pedobacter mucosus]UKT64777.1 response regulator [Pedobacter mucosus]